MAKVIILLAFPLLLFACFLSARQQLEDVVYLKNGAIMRGIIIEQRPMESLKIQTRDGNVFVITMEEIEKITKEPQSMNVERSTPLEKSEKKVEDVPESRTEKEDKKSSVFLGAGYKLGKLAGNDDDLIRSISGPDGESFSTFAILGGFEFGPGALFRFDFGGYDLEKQWVDNIYPNTWNWKVRMLSLLGGYRVNLTPQETPTNLFLGLFGGPTFGWGSIEITEIDLNSLSQDSGKISHSEIGFTIGGNLEVRTFNDRLGLVLEPSYTKLSASLEDEVDVEGSYNVGVTSFTVYIKWISPLN